MVPNWNSDLTIIEPSRDGGVIVDSIRRFRRDEAPRTGLHCSTIVNDYMRTAYPKKRRDFAEKTTLVYQEIGNVIEDVLAEGLRRRLGWEKPAPRLFDDIWCSPDGYDRRSRTIDEIKATWVSERDFEDSPKCHGYLLQALEYAKAFDARRLRLHVVFLCGNWRPPVPNARTFIVRWKDGGLEKNHFKLRQHAEDRGWL